MNSAEIREQAFKRFPQPPEEERQRALQYALTGLEQHSPGMTAKGKFARWQRWSLICALLLIVVGCVFNAHLTIGIVVTLLVIFYAVAMFARGIVFVAGMRAVESSRAVEIPALADSELPKYTILMPAYNEPEVIVNLVRATSSIDYPHDKFQLLLLLEEDDDRTIEALLKVEVPEIVKVLLVPASDPRTKPKACNYGLYFDDSELVTIYDAEDRPDAGQLRASAAKFAASPEHLVCLQARLDYYNSTQNALTRWFTIEYATWFGMFLPGLDALQLPIPLGGTSNHIRTQVLRDMGAWDAFNVTEDADLGLRFFRAGYITGVLDSITDEEANSEPVNWVRQRSRWYKGYIQTWLVHTRDLGSAFKEFRLKGLASITLLIGATPFLASINLFAGLCTLVFIIGVPHEVYTVFPLAAIYIGVTLTLLGNAATVYLSVLAMVYTKESKFAWISLLYPIYWLLMALAATKAIYQLIRKPFYWEKTLHGLDVTGEAAP
jgi:glycosyltransferase XagB